MNHSIIYFSDKSSRGGSQDKMKTKLIYCKLIFNKFLIAKNINREPKRVRHLWVMRSPPKHPPRKKRLKYKTNR